MGLRIENIFQGRHTIQDVMWTPPGAGYTIQRERMVRPNAVAALVHDINTDEFIFVKQWRAGVLDMPVEIVAGKIDYDEPHEDAIKREVLEEVGYEVENLRILAKEFYTSPACLSEMMTVFYCQVSNKVNDGGGLESEQEHIEVVRMSRYEFLDYKFQDAKSIIAKLIFFGCDDPLSLPASHE